ncbi:MAG: hypothetical protein Q9190_006916 [Brigantiaea leucoxantha]
MEPVIFPNSPLALYLEGEGKAQEELSSTSHSSLTESSAHSLSFVPRNTPIRFRRFHKKPLHLLNLDTPPSKGATARLLGTFSSALKSRSGWTENGRFLEQFRYTIIASQLLNEPGNPVSHKRTSKPKNDFDEYASANKGKSLLAFSWLGLFLTTASAFALAWSIYWSSGIIGAQTSIWRVLLIPLIAALSCTVLHAYFRRQRLHWVRVQALESASSLISSAQNFDAAITASIIFIQEIELVSRGYRISSPLPPVSRLEEQSQSKKCRRLRQILRKTLFALSISYREAFQRTRKLAVEIDLEKYSDIYEISQSDIQDAEGIQNTYDCVLEDEYTLKGLKTALQSSHSLRKLLLCSLLAINSNGTKSDSAKWIAVTNTMDCLTREMNETVQEIDEMMGVEEDFSIPATPKAPLTPIRERMKTRMRKLNALSQGIRGLQAKLHLLRDESDKLAEVTNHSSLKSTIHYESIGADLKLLLEEWEEGRASFASETEKARHRLSLHTLDGAVPSSPTLSLGGITAVGGSPTEDSAAFCEYPKSHQSCPSTTTNSSVLEARLEQAQLLKKVVDAIKDLVQDCNFDCNDSGIALQAMDNSHVALVSMMLKAESFSPFRCDRNIALGINLNSLMKVLRCAQNEDILTLKAEDAPDVVNLVFESAESDRLSEYDIKLMDIDQEHLGIPETDYAATISMPSSEFQRICRDLIALSESVAIEATKDGVKFSCTGDIGSGAVTLRSHTNVENPEKNIDISLSEPVALTFSLKYLVNFCKASGLSGTVKLCLSSEVPLLVEYALAANSYLRFYLAPKIGDEEG